MSFNISTVAMMALGQRPGDDHQIRDENAPTDPALEAIQPVSRATPKLAGALDPAAATLDPIAKAQTFPEPVLLFIGAALRRARSGFGEGEVLDAQAASQAFLVWREEAAISSQDVRGMSEAFAMLAQQRRPLSGVRRIALGDDLPIPDQAMFDLCHPGIQPQFIALRQMKTLRLDPHPDAIAGIVLRILGDAAMAFDFLHESEVLCRKFGYKDELASVLLYLVYITLEIHGRKSAEQLQSYLEESLDLSQGSVDPWAAVRIEGILARLAFYRGDMAEARRHADLMLDLHREMGDQRSIIGHQSDMAHVAREMGNYQEALALYRETLPDWQKLGYRGAVPNQLECMAFIAKAQE